MRTTPEVGLTRLAAGGMLPIHDGVGLTLAVLDGQVWITQAGDIRDSFLAKGESLRVDRPGLVLVEALTDARVAMWPTGTEMRFVARTVDGMAAANESKGTTFNPERDRHELAI